MTNQFESFKMPCMFQFKPLSFCMVSHSNQNKTGSSSLISPFVVGRGERYSRTYPAGAGPWPIKVDISVHNTNNDVYFLPLCVKLYKKGKQAMEMVVEQQTKEHYATKTDNAFFQNRCIENEDLHRPIGLRIILHFQFGTA